MLPRTPLVHYALTTPGKSGGTFIPGQDDRTRTKVELLSFEYTDVWAGLDHIKMEFSDPFHALCDHPKLRELETVIDFSFGYADAMTPAHRMTLFRVMQKYPSDGKVTTELHFFAKTINMSALRRNVEYRSQTSGKALLATEVVERVAVQNGLRPVITPCVADPGLSRVVWRQKNETDMAFLRRIMRGARAAENGRGGKYFIWIRDDELHCAPIGTDKRPLFTFTYRHPDADAPLRSFSPQLPADMMRGMGWVAGYGGFDGETKQESSGQITQKDDPDAPAMDRKTIDFANRMTVNPFVQQKTTAPAVLPMRNEEIEKQRTSLENQKRLHAAAIIAARKSLLAEKVDPKSVEDALQADKDAIKDLDVQIQNLYRPDGDKLPLPSEKITDNFTADNFRQAQMLMLTGSAELWGFPFVTAGDPVYIDGVSARFGQTWWVREVRHKIDTSQGFITTWDMQKNALGVGDLNPAIGGQSQPLTEVVVKVDVRPPHEAQYVAQPTQAYYDLLAEDKARKEDIRRSLQNESNSPSADVLLKASDFLKSGK